MRTLIFALFSIALSACAASTQSAPTPPAAIHLAGTKWIRVDDFDANPHPPTMDFDANRASGFSGCNRWFASVTQNGEALRFGQTGSTRMACTAEPAAAAEQRFFAVIEATRYAHYDQDALVLLDESQHQLARFERGP
jgi:heat shock protein HslJ